MAGMFSVHFQVHIEHTNITNKTTIKRRKFPVILNYITRVADALGVETEEFVIP